MFYQSLVFAFMLFSANALANPHITPQIGIKIYDPESDKLLYEGIETVTTKNNEVTKKSSYKNTKNATIQEDICVYDMRSLQVSQFKLKHLVTGETSEVVQKENTYTINYTAKSGDTTETTQLPIKPKHYLGKVMHHIIIDRWTQLESGEAYRFDLIIPSRLETIGFQIVKQQMNDTQTVFRMQPDSWLIRRFVDPLDFYYDRATKRLMRYTGPSFISSDQDTVIRADFSYPKEPTL